MEQWIGRLKPANALALFLLAAALLAWFGPFTGDTETRRLWFGNMLYDATLAWPAEAFGKGPTAIGLVVLALLALLYGLGLRLPALPKRAPGGKTEEITGPSKRMRQAGIRTEAEHEATGFVRKPMPDDVTSGKRRPSPQELLDYYPELRPAAEAEYQRRHEEMVAELERRGTPHGERVDPVAIVRKARDPSRDWSADRSHFGGRPRLGDAEWPRDAQGAPLPFIAQLDLAEIAAVHPDTPLPKTGSLAFFLGSGAVMHVPEGDHNRVDPPADMPHAYEDAGCPPPGRNTGETRGTFLYWPVEPIRLRLPDGLPEPSDDIDSNGEVIMAQKRALGAVVPSREFAFTTGGPSTAGVEGTDTVWWYCSNLFLDELRAAHNHLPERIATKEGQAAEIERLHAKGQQLAELIAHFETFTAGREPWAEMAPDEVDVLRDVIAEARNGLQSLCGFIVARDLDSLRTAAIRRMITGEPDAASALPDALLDFLNTGYRRPITYEHQMFGLGACPQSALYDHLSDHLLLQIANDDLAEIQFGEVGVFHFWISPEDLAARRWDQVQLTFECG